MLGMMTKKDSRKSRLRAVPTYTFNLKFQLTFRNIKAIETLEKAVKYVQS